MKARITYLLYVSLFVFCLVACGCDCDRHPCSKCDECPPDNGIHIGHLPGDDDTAPDDDDTTPDDDTGDDDTTDDDTGDDDTIDDDTTDDDTGDDDTIDDDTADDDTTPADDDISVNLEYVDGGQFSGAALVESLGGQVYVVANKASETRVYEEGIGDWSYEVADHGVFANPSVAVAANGSLHLAYYDWFEKQIWYDKKTGGSWSAEIVDSDGDVGHYSAIAVDAQNHAFIAYNVESSGTSISVRLADNTGGSWNIDTIASGTNIGDYPALALDQDGNPYVLYDTPSSVNLARRTKKGWETTALPASASFRRSGGLAFNSSNVLHIIYRASDAAASLRHASGSFDELTSELIDGTVYVGDTLAMAVDDNDIVHYTYYNYHDVEIIYGNNADKDWSVESLGSGYPVFIAARSINDVAISLGYLGVFRKDGASWVQDFFDHGYAAVEAALAVDGQGGLHAAIWDGTTQSVRYAKKTAGEWQPEMVMEAAGYVNQNIALAVDADGQRHICFYNGLSLNLNCAYQDGGIWHLDVVDENSFAGRYVDLVLDGSGVLHLSYSDEANGKIKYAKGATGDWEVFTLDTPGLVGLRSAIAIDADDQVYIAYVDASNNDIKLATGQDNAWTLETVDAGGGDYVSLALDPDERPHVAYIGGGLRHAVKDGGLWTTEIVDPTASALDTDIAFPSAGQGYIAYNSLNWKLGFARWSGDNWSLYTLDDVGVTGLFVSMHAAAGQPTYISYVGTDALWLATVN